jgi:hypothetical protein
VPRRRRPAPASAPRGRTRAAVAGTGSVDGETGASGGLEAEALQQVSGRGRRPVTFPCVGRPRRTPWGRRPPSARGHQRRPPSTAVANRAADAPKCRKRPARAASRALPRSGPSAPSCRSLRRLRQPDRPGGRLPSGRQFPRPHRAFRYYFAPTVTYTVAPRGGALRARQEAGTTPQDLPSWLRRRPQRSSPFLGARAPAPNLPQGAESPSDRKKLFLESR